MIYFVQAGKGGDVKIGYTENDINKRFADLQSANSKQLVLLATLDGNRNTERALHRQFKNDRVRGEWYRFSNALRDFLYSTDPHRVNPEESIIFKDGYNIDSRLAEIEKFHIEKALRDCNNSKPNAAVYLGISFRSMRYRCDKFGI